MKITILLILTIFASINSAFLKENCQPKIEVTPLTETNIPKLFDQSLEMLTPNLRPQDSSKLKTAEIAEEKIKVNLDSVYPAKVDLPYYIGNQPELVKAKLYDKAQNQVVEKTVLVDKPIIKHGETIMNIDRKDTFLFKKSDGSEVKPDTKLEYHGV